MRARLAPHVLRRAGAAFLTGPALDDAVRVARRLERGGVGVSLGYWDGGEDSPYDVESRLLACIERAGALGGTPRVSVKAPPLQFDEAIVGRLARSALENGVGLVLDAHGPEHADATLALARVAARLGADTGVAVPARWERSAHDARAAVDDGLRVRVVKGQWHDERSPRAAGDAGLREAVVALLDGLTGSADRITVATHDGRLLESLTRGRRLVGELELLLGLPARRALAAAARAGLPVRYYLPFGHPSIGFDVHEIPRRPRLGVALAEGVLLGRANQRLRELELRRSPVTG